LAERQRREESNDEEPFGSISDFFDEAEDEDGNLDDGYNADEDENDDEDGDGEDGDDGFDAWVDRLATEVDEQGTKHRLYKGMQRTMAQKDDRLQEQADALSDAVDLINQQNDKQVELQGSFTDFQSAIDGLLTAEQREALGQLTDSARGRRTAGYDRDAQSSGSQPSQTEKAQIRKYKREFVQELKETAEDAGLDPEDSRLDYGDEDGSLLERQKAFRASVKAAVKADKDDRDDGEDEGKQRSRRRRKVTNRPRGASTRQSQGSSPRSKSAQSNLESGADEHMKTIRKLVRTG